MDKMIFVFSAVQSSTGDVFLWYVRKRYQKSGTIVVFLERKISCTLGTIPCSIYARSTHRYFFVGDTPRAERRDRSEVDRLLIVIVILCQSLEMCGNLSKVFDQLYDNSYRGSLPLTSKFFFFCFAEHCSMVFVAGGGGGGGSQSQRLRVPVLCVLTAEFSPKHDPIKLTNAMAISGRFFLCGT